MSVYLVYRSHYEGPAGKYVKRFDDATLLDWFRNHWQGVADQAAHRHAEKLLGTDVYGFASLFRNIAEHSLAPPRTEAELAELLEEHLYVEGEIIHKPHLLQVLTDDDEIQLAYYFFDDQYLAHHADQTAYLLHEDWRLPGGHAPGTFVPAAPGHELTPAGHGKGHTYLNFLAYYDSGNLDDLEGPRRIDGVRLPDLARYLARTTPGTDWPFELRLLRSQLLQPPAGATRQEKVFLKALAEHPDDEASWMAYSAWLQEQGQPPAGQAVLARALKAASRYPVGPITNSVSTAEFGRGSLESAREELEGLVAQLDEGVRNHNPRKSLAHVEDHLAQLCLHTARWGKRDLFHQWIIFDDQWAVAHRALANAVLRYAARWDVLS